MASIIRVKRSTGTGAPANLNFGELGLTVGVGTHGNKGGRLFAGDNAQNAQVVGGRYYTDLLSIAPGLIAGQDNPTTQSNGFVPILLTENGGNPGGGGNITRLPRVDQWSVDNLTLDGNTISSNDTDGDIVIRTNGSGEIVIPDDQFLTFGDSKDAKIEYDENGTNKVQVTGANWVWNNCAIEVNGESFSVDNVGISSNVISTKSGGGNQLFIDPFPDGLSNEGTVIIKGDLQIDGTTTTVNSNNVTVNDSIFNIGDVTSVRTVMGTVNAGVSTVLLDSVVGINTGDQLAAAGIDASGIGTVTAYNAASKVVTYTGTATGITTETQVNVTHGFDTNTDRGISFNYNTGSGVGNNKVGFFGYNDSSGEGSSAVQRAWTYIPDATVTGSVATGTRGYLDIKGIYYQTGDYNTHGVSYFDVNGLQTSTNNPTDATNTRTSTQILTAVTEITIELPSGQTIAQDDLVTQQNNSTAFGVCKTSITSGSTLTLIGVQGTFDATNDLVVNGASISVAPNSITTVYANKPTWTNTLDGGTF
jgi:hypothetical protein